MAPPWAGTMNLRRNRHRRLGEQTGITLVELLVAASLLATVFAIAVPALVKALTAEPKISARSAQVSSARAAVERMARDLRQGYAIDGAGPTTLSFRTYARRTTCGSGSTPSASTPAILCQVTYACSAGECIRSEAEPGQSGGTSVVLVGGLLPGTVFTYLPNATEPTYVEIRLAFQDREGQETVTIDDGINLRNIRG